MKNQVDSEVAKKSTSCNDFTFIDLFAGIGGFRQGFDAIGGRCVFTAEWDQHCIQTYTANYDCDHLIVGDITQLKTSQIPPHNVLLAGFPCQPFSLSGVSKRNSLGKVHGFECKTQGTLFFDVVRILKSHKPNAFLLENVKNLLTHNHGNTFKTIKRILSLDLGYELHARVIDAKSYVPQHRERLFIVGFKQKNDFSFDNLNIPNKDRGPVLNSILHPENSTEQHDEKYLFGSKGKVRSKYTLSDHLWQYLQNYAAKHHAKGNGFGFGLVGPNDVARTLSARYFKDGSEILIRQRRRQNPRRLTPRECARLMGFESACSPRFEIPVSDTQAYRQFGNAVVVPVVKVIATHMQPWIMYC